MDIDYELLGLRLSNIRKQQKLTQEKLAEKTNLANNYISNIENGRSIPSLETLIKLCEALEITPNDLLVGTATTSPSYMVSDLDNILKICTPEEKKLIEGIIRLIISQRRQ
ncbi:MAG: helix-turn-helix domain-containing protein [Oscillospiraceae bacterium]|jgi:transcriptional regulator with XRE-family HTH domain|nr:helix-turn-helix domain-containing protein [Oscillospiraceae bacterium]